MSASLLVSCVGVATRPGLCPIAKETAQAAPTLYTENGPNGWKVCGENERIQAFLQIREGWRGYKGRTATENLIAKAWQQKIIAGREKLK